MPNPKRRHSKARTAKRRAHDHLQAPGLSVCPRCGYYKGKAVTGGEEA